MFVCYLKPSAPHMFPSTTSPAGPGNQSVRVLCGSDNAMALTPAALRSPLATTVGMSCLSEPMSGIMFWHSDVQCVILGLPRANMLGYTVYIYVYMNICMYIYVCMHACMHVCMYVCMSV